MWGRMCSFRITWSLEKRKKKKKLTEGNAHSGNWEMWISSKLFLDQLTLELIRSWFLEMSTNFYSSLSRENSTDAITNIIFCIFCFENLISGLDWDVRTSQELDFRLITITKNSLKFTYPGQRLETSSLFRYTLLPGGEGGGVGGYSPINVTGVLVVPFRGLNLWIGTA